MATEGVGGLVVRFYEALHNDHDLTLFDTAVDPKVVCRWSGLPELHGPEELRQGEAVPALAGRARRGGGRGEVRDRLAVHPEGHAQRG